MTGPRRDTAAVVVTYHPDPGTLTQLLAELLRQVGHVVVVDNAPGSGVSACLPRGAQGIELVENDRNLGIAAAQNIGIEHALRVPTCAFVLLCDHDSLPAPDMVENLRAAFEGHAGPEGIAAVGPWTVDRRTGTPSHLILDDAGRPRHRVLALPDANADANSEPSADAAATEPVEVAFLIASGTLIPAAVLRALRGMRSGYFIDHVDTEWCFRARAAGYRLLLVPRARLLHRLGDSVRRVWVLRTRRVAVHSPLRDYYMFRNTLLMLREVRMPPGWRRHFLWRLVQFAAYFLSLGDHRYQRLRLMVLGLRHGRAGVSGCLDADTRRCTAVAPTAWDPVP